MLISVSRCTIDIDMHALRSSSQRNDAKKKNNKKPRSPVRGQDPSSPAAGSEPQSQATVDYL
jgi:hypothetical protein